MESPLSRVEHQMKTYVDGGCTLAEAFLKTFSDQRLTTEPTPMKLILNKLSIQVLNEEGQYYFADGSRLSIDPIEASMSATKAPRH